MKCNICKRGNTGKINKLCYRLAYKCSSTFLFMCAKSLEAPKNLAGL